LIQQIIDRFLKTGNVQTIDERGYYICDEVINGGQYYIYADGIIREGVCADDSTAFWEHEADAQEFLAAWQEKRKNVTE